ncbi:MAG: ketosteroid isomerase [Gemmatimonadetes bacterium]|nr:ketosteroid isomerase [Gemmatimonadota bacterium]
MHPNEELVRRLYDALNAHDAAAMTACYAPDAVFSDPAFGELAGAEVGAMWSMLCSRGKDLRATVDAVRADDETGSAEWEARYTYSGSRRPVHNVISATYRFRDGLIVEHRDSFDLWKWMGQALGPAGTLLGWTPVMQARVRGGARAALSSYIGRQPEPQPVA